MLTAQEQAELNALMQEEQMAQQMMQNPQSQMQQKGGLTPDEAQELALLEQEEMMAQQMQPQQLQINPEREADLGFTTRAQYAIEPLESNRRALLIEKFGAENIKEDAEGNVYVKQGNQFLPVNKEGVSFADVVDFAGATPEMVGALGAGIIGGLTTGGLGAIPSAAAGAGLGSAARQGLSAMIGTPQVAELSERAGEVALSTGFGAGGAVIGKLGKTAVRKLLPKFKIDKAFQQMAQDIGITDLTPGQKAGGRELMLEKQLQETPVFGRKIRKTVEGQVEKIKDNLSSQFGDISEMDFDRAEAGAMLKDRVKSINKAIKDQASSLFDEVASQGNKVSVPSMEFNNSLYKQFNNLGLMDNSGNLLEHSAKTGLTETQFNRLQQIAKKITDQVSRTGEPLEGLAEETGTELIAGAQNFARPSANFITANDLNTIRKFIDANIKEGAQAGVDDVALIKLRNSFMDITEDMLGAQDKSLKRKFRSARALYKKYLDDRNLLEKNLKLSGKSELSDEQVVNRIFLNKKNVESFKKMASQKEVNAAANDYIRNILAEKIGKEGKKTAASALSAVRKKREAISAAIGDKAYNNMVKNLRVLDRIGEPINPSGTFIEKIKNDLPRGALLSLKRQATVSAETVENLPQLLGSRANLLTDPAQREVSFEGFASPKVPYRPQR